MLILAGQETYHDNEDFTQNNFRSSFRELTFDGTRYCFDHGIDGCRVRRGVQCSAIKDRERRPSVYIPFNQTVVDRGKMSSRFMKINEYVPNKASLASMNRASGMQDITGGVALTWKHMPSYKTSRTMSH
jgi:hypothetical protein